MAREGGKRGVRWGVILPVVLFILIMIGLLGAGFAFRVHADFAATQVNASKLQTRLAAEAGIERVKGMLRLGRFDRESWYNNPVELHRVILWAHGEDSRIAGTNQEIDETMVYRFSIVADDPLDDRDYVRFGITDESSKLNINVCTEKQLLHVVTAALAGNTEVNPQEIVDAIMDWRDADSSPRGEAGDTEGKYYEELPLNPYRVKNGPLDTVEELLLVKGVTPQILFGEDMDRNGLLTPNEDDGDRSFPPDNQDGELNRGLYPYVTTFSKEPNVANDNRPRAYLFGDQAAIRAEAELAFPENAEFAEFIVSASRASYQAQQGGGKQGGQQPGGAQQGGSQPGSGGGEGEQDDDGEGGQQGGQGDIGSSGGQPGTGQPPGRQLPGGRRPPGGASPGGNQPNAPGGGRLPARPGADSSDAGPDPGQTFGVQTAIVLASYQVKPPRDQGSGSPVNPGTGGSRPVRPGRGPQNPATGDNSGAQQPDGKDAPGSGGTGTEGNEEVEGTGDPGTIPTPEEGKGGGGEQNKARKIYSPAGLLFSTKIEGRDADSPLGLEHLPVLMDRFTTVNPEQKGIEGLININTAPRLVLECIDGLTPDQIEAIIATRERLDAETSSTTAWLVTEGIMELEAYDKIANSLTARGTQFTVESLGYSDHQGLVTRLEAIVEFNGPVVQTIYYRDLSYLGGRFPIREEDARRNKRVR